MAATQPGVFRHLRKLVETEHISQLPDQDLVQRFAATRDEAAFAMVVQRHGPMVLHLCQRLLRHIQDAEDAFQAVFLVLARKATSIHKRTSVSSWLYGVAHRVARETMREGQRRRARESRAMPRLPAAPAIDLSWREVGEVLDEELARLPDRYRAPLVLCFLESKTQDEASRQLGWSLGTFRRRLELGRNILRARLTRRGVELAAGLSVTSLLPSTAPAFLPPTLAAATIQLSVAFALPQTILPVGLSARVAALADAGVKTPLAFKIKLALVVGLALTSLVAGAALALQQVFGDKESGDPQPAAKGPAPWKRMPEKQSRTDLYGDPLPDGVLTRLGSTRLQHAGVTDVRFLPGGKTVVSIGTDGWVRTWDVATGRQAGALKLAGESGQRGTISPDGKTLAAHDKGKLVFWAVDSGKEIKTVPLEDSRVAFLSFALDGKTLAVGSWSSQVTLWEWETGKHRRLTLPQPKLAKSSVTAHGAFSPDGKWFLAASAWSDDLCVFERTSGRQAYRLNCHCTGAAVSPDGKRLAVASRPAGPAGTDTLLRLYDLANGKEVARRPLGVKDARFSLTFSPNGKTIACAGSDEICLLDPNTGRVRHRLSGQTLGAAFSPDGNTLVASEPLRRSIRLWDVATGKERHERRILGRQPVLAVSPDGRLLAEASWWEHAVGLWDTRSGQLIRQLPLKGEKRFVAHLRFSADGRTLIAVQAKGFVHLWDVDSGKERQAVQVREPGRPDPVLTYWFAPCLTPDGRYLCIFEMSTRPEVSMRLGR
jgi:RNA polymerase sigma factor (sigma-70 family)